jgi:hypothetical protein
VEYFDFFHPFHVLPGSITNTRSWLNPFIGYPHSKFCFWLVHRVNEETHENVQNLNPTFYLPYTVMKNLDNSTLSYAAWGHDRCASKHTHTHLSKAWTHKLLVCKFKKIIIICFCYLVAKYILYNNNYCYYY